MENILNENLLHLNRIYDGKVVLLNEASDLTYYELRRLITMLFKMSKDKDAKKVISEVLKNLTVLELKNKPVPTIQKLKTVSPKIFGE